MVKILFVIGITFFFLITLPYILVEYDLISILLLHFVLSISTVLISYTMLFGKNNLYYIGGIFFVSWYLFNLFGFARLVAIQDFSVNEIIFIYLIVITAVWSCFGGYILVRSWKRGSLPGINLLPKVTKVSGNIYVWIFVGVLFLIGFEMWAAGGIERFIAAPYAEKHLPGLENIIFVLRAIFFGGFYFLSLAVIFDSMKGKHIKILACFYIFLFIALSIFRGNTGVLLISAIVPLFYIYARHYSKSPRSTNIFIINKKILHLVIVGVSVLIVSFLVAFTVRLTRAEGGLELEHISKMWARYPVIDTLVYSATFNHIESFARILQHYGWPYSFGENLILPFVNFIPRAIWPDKPIGLGRRIVIEIHGAPPDTVVSFAPSMLGEFYFDFGFIGVFFLPFLMGLILGAVESFFRLHRDNVYMSFFYLQATFVFVNLINSFSGFGIRFIYMLLFWYMVSVLSRIRIRQNKNNAAISKI